MSASAESKSTPHPDPLLVRGGEGRKRREVLVTVMAHGVYAAQSAFERHLPFWRSLGYPMQVVTPEDCPVETGLTRLMIGKASHHGVQANGRFREMLRLLSLTDYEWFVIHEYDSINLCREIPETIFKTPGLWANVFGNDDPHFKAKQYFHPPLIMDMGTLKALVKAVDMKSSTHRITPHLDPLPSEGRGNGLSDGAEGGFWDRWLGVAAELAGVRVNAYGPMGYSKNTIEEGDWTEARRAVERGAMFLHGVKTEETLEAIAGEQRGKGEREMETTTIR